MEDAQADALAARNVTAFSLPVDWAALGARQTTAEPQPTGYSVRWYATRFSLGGGYATLQSEGRPTDQNGVYNNIPTLRDAVQPYAVYVPTDYTPSRPASLTLILHALQANYNEYGGLDPRLIQQLCEQRYSICVMPEGLGPGLDWQGKGQTDLWQVWRAVAGSYSIDPNKTVVAGYSMGGSGTNIMATERPDDFAGALILDGPEAFWPFANARWVPFVLDESVADELAPQYVAIEEADKFKALGQRYQLLLHVGGEHSTWATEDRFEDAVAALGSPVRATNPPSFSYTWTPASTDAADGLGATSDYWLGSLLARSPAHDASLSVNDHALPQPAIKPVLSGPAYLPYATPGIGYGLSWSYGPAPGTAQTMSLSLTNVARVSVNLTRAGLRGGTLTVTSDGPARLELHGLLRSTRIVLAGRSVVRRSGQTAALSIARGTSTVVLTGPASPAGCRDRSASRCRRGRGSGSKPGRARSRPRR
jgi:pimeloyl-ACP methyl ester carboxylesterase